MGKVHLSILFILTLVSLKAGYPLQVKLEDLVHESDHILTGTLYKIDMINQYGIEITDPEARTGPGSGNYIRLHFNVDKVHFTNSSVIPSTVIVPLDPDLHYEIKHIREAEPTDGSPRLLLLRGENFNAPYVGVFQKPMEMMEQIFEIKREQLLKAEQLSLPNQKSLSTAEKRGDKP